MRQPYRLFAPGTRRGNPHFIVRGRRPNGREYEATTRCADQTDAERVAATIHAGMCAEGPAADKPVAGTFGDAADPAWAVTKHIDDNRAYHVFEELNTFTAVVYLKKVTR